MYEAFSSWLSLNNQDFPPRNKPEDLSNTEAHPEGQPSHKEDLTDTTDLTQTASSNFELTDDQTSAHISRQRANSSS